MHATIAGLSSGVPTAAVSYSDKTLGVFETCGQGEHVHDPRRLDTNALVDAVLRSFRERDSARASLATHLPAVLAKASEQMDEIVALCGACRGAHF
jgi:polysaccharide pyruvyl transferase WcaK-like protein